MKGKTDELEAVRRGRRDGEKHEEEKSHPVKKWSGLVGDRDPEG